MQLKGQVVDLDGTQIGLSPCHRQAFKLEDGTRKALCQVSLHCSICANTSSVKDEHCGLLQGQSVWCSLQAVMTACKCAEHVCNHVLSLMWQYYLGGCMFRRRRIPRHGPTGCYVWVWQGQHRQQVRWLCSKRQVEQAWHPLSASWLSWKGYCWLACLAQDPKQVQGKGYQHQPVLCSW